MTKFKNVIASLLLVTVLISSLGIVGIAAEADEAAVVEETAPIAEAVVVEETKQIAYAKGLGLIEEYDAEKIVTVGELANAINVLSDAENVADIYLKKGRYTKNASLAEAITIFTDMIGYVKVAEVKYGSSDFDKIILVAKQQGLLTGVSTNYKKELTMEDFVNLSYNMLYSTILDTRYESNGNVIMEENEHSYMNAIMDMYEVKDIVQSVTYTSIITKKGTETDTIIIGGRSYSCEIAKYDDYIGHNVDALIKEEDGKLKLVALYSRSEVVTIDAEDLDSATRNSITYYNKSDKKITHTITVRPDVIYNYSLMPGYVADDFMIDYGKLTLIDNNNDGEYDVVKIEEYKSMRVLSIPENSEVIIDSYGNKIKIEEMVNNGYPVYEGGVVTTPDNIATGKVISYYENKDGQVVKIYVSSQIEAGKITSFRMEKNLIKLDTGKEYKYLDNVKDKLEDQRMGDLVTLYLDYYGNVAYYELSSDVYKHGYLLGFTNDVGTFENPQVRVYTQDNEFVVFDTKTKITVNGKTMLSSEAFAKSNGDFWDITGKQKSQLIKYRANTNNEMTVILTAVDATGGAEVDESLGRFRLDYKGQMRYFSTPMAIRDNVRLRKDTTVLLLPDSIHNTEFEHRFRFGGPALLTTNALKEYEVYNVDENGYAGAVIWKNGGDYKTGTIDEIAGKVYLVKETGKFIEDRGTESVFINAIDISSGKLDTKEFRMDRADFPNTSTDYKGLEPDTINVGDLIILVADVNNTAEVTAWKYWLHGDDVLAHKDQPHFEYQKGNFIQNALTDYSFYADGNMLAFGDVVKLVEYGVVINSVADAKVTTGLVKSDFDRLLTIDKEIPVYIHEKGGRDEIRLGSYSDLQPGDAVFTLARSGLPKGFVIYR